MREEVVTYKVYKFNELSEKTQEKVLNKFRETPLDYEWWDGCYDMFHEDLKEVGLECKTFYFSLDRDWHIDPHQLGFTDVTKFVRSFDTKVKQSIIDTADLIIQAHSGRNAWYDITTYEGIPDRCPRLNKAIDSLIDACNEKLKDMLHGFLNSLQEESDYLTSDKTIKEHIDCNNIEFLANGDIF